MNLNKLLKQIHTIQCEVIKLKKGVSANTNISGLSNEERAKFIELKEKLDSMKCLNTACEDIEDLKNFKQSQGEKNTDSKSRLDNLRQELDTLNNTVTYLSSHKVINELRELIMGNTQVIEQLSEKDFALERLIGLVSDSISMIEATAETMVEGIKLDIQDLKPLIEKVEGIKTDIDDLKLYKRRVAANVHEIQLLKQKPEYTTEKTISDIENTPEFQERLKTLINLNIKNCCEGEIGIWNNNPKRIFTKEFSNQFA